ncbi:MAG: hypothetical protein ACRD1V_06905 [Vicinamibacterales bacterium]
MTRLLVGIAVTALAATIARPAKTDRDRAELDGPVHTVATRWQANHKNADGEVEDRELGVTEYDAAGNLVVSREYTGAFVRERRPERHGHDETLFRSPAGSALERFVYDGHDNIIERREWYKDTADGPPDVFERMKYDAADREIESESFAGNNALLDATIYTRDARGLILIEEHRRQDANPPYPRMHYTYTLDAHRNWTARIVTRENVPEDAYDYQYAGNLFRTITYFSR